MTDPLRSGAIFRIANPQALKSPLPYHILLQRQQQQQQQQQQQSPTMAGVFRPQAVYAKIPPTSATPTNGATSANNTTTLLQRPSPGGHGLNASPVVVGSQASVVDSAGFKMPFPKRPTATIMPMPMPMPMGGAASGSTSSSSSIASGGQTTPVDKALPISSTATSSKPPSPVASSAETPAGNTTRPTSTSTTGGGSNEDPNFDINEFIYVDGYRTAPNTPPLAPADSASSSSSSSSSSAPAKRPSTQDTNVVADLQRTDVNIGAIVEEAHREVTAEEDDDKEETEERMSTAASDQLSRIIQNRIAARSSSASVVQENPQDMADTTIVAASASASTDKNETSDESSGEENEEEEAPELVTKKKRGRPPKTQAPASTSAVATKKPWAGHGSKKPSQQKTQQQKGAKRLSKLSEAQQEEDGKLTAGEWTLDSEFIRTHPGVHYESWWLRDVVVVNQPGLLPVVVEGIKVLQNGQKQMWHSSLIAERIDARTLKSSSGNTYYLHGKLNNSGMLSNQFPEAIIQAFENGFPPDWKVIIRRHKGLLDEHKSESDREEIAMGASAPKIKKSKKQGNGVLSKVGPESVKLKTPAVPSTSTQKPQGTVAQTSTGGRTRRQSGITPEMSFKLEWGTGKLKPVTGERRARVERVVELEDSPVVQNQVSRPASKQNSSASTVTRPSGSTTVVKRPRGRPRKHPITEAQPAESMESVPKSTEAQVARVATDTAWLPAEDRILEREMYTKDPKSPQFWQLVAEALPGKTAKQCQERYQAGFGRGNTEEGGNVRENVQPPPTKKKASDTKKPQGNNGMAGKKTLTRKRQLRQLMKEREDAHAGDDLFGGGSSSSNNEDDHALEKDRILSKEPAEQKGMDSTKKRRKLSGVCMPEESPEILKPYKASNHDAYIRNLKPIESGRPGKKNSFSAALLQNKANTIADKRLDREMEDVLSGKKALPGRKRNPLLDDDNDDEEEEEQRLDDHVAQGLQLYATMNED